MKRITAGLFVMALALSLILPTSVQGWGFTGEVWDVINDDVTYCFEGSLTTAQKNAVRPAVDAYDNLPNSELDLLEESCGIGANIRIRIGQTEGNQLARHTGQAVNGEYVTPQYVTIDVDRMVDIQWSTTHPIFCTVTSISGTWQGGNDCKADIFVVAAHEVGHAVGLDHNTTPETQWCVSGYTHELPASACTNDYYSLSIMWFSAGDGYHRIMDTDTKGGIAALY